MIELTKGIELDLEKALPELVAAMLGMGWNVNKDDSPDTTEDDFDLDSSVFMLNEKGKLPDKHHVVYYNNLKSPDSEVCIEHMGDNLTGAGEGDDEVILFDLRKVPDYIHKLVITVTIHRAKQRNQNFGMVENAFLRVVNVSSKEEVLRFDLDEEFTLETSVILTEIYRTDTGWAIKALAEGVDGGLDELVSKYTA
ncbi:TerD family protein [Cyanothece sp. BG0011]|uniref:TerD family protein n=1 Tax=Cyanothece sp. BG0011 TaxID=2082950 RepID=UPI000D1D836B|nr:TerD family protein [Cyanothece sp. BG0011]